MAEDSATAFLGGCLQELAHQRDLENAVAAGTEKTKLAACRVLTLAIFYPTSVTLTGPSSIRCSKDIVPVSRVKWQRPWLLMSARWVSWHPQSTSLWPGTWPLQVLTYLN